MHEDPSYAKDSRHLSWKFRLTTLPSSSNHAFPLMAKPTELQYRAFDLLAIDTANPSSTPESHI